jgi:hypothetical protein
VKPRLELNGAGLGVIRIYSAKIGILTDNLTGGHAADVKIERTSKAMSRQVSRVPKDYPVFPVHHSPLAKTLLGPGQTRVNVCVD